MLVSTTKNNTNRPCSKVLNPPQRQSLLCHLKTFSSTEFQLLFEEYFVWQYPYRVLIPIWTSKATFQMNVYYIKS